MARAGWACLNSMVRLSALKPASSMTCSMMSCSVLLRNTRLWRFNARGKSGDTRCKRRRGPSGLAPSSSTASTINAKCCSWPPAPSTRKVAGSPGRDAREGLMRVSTSTCMRDREDSARSFEAKHSTASASSPRPAASIKKRHLGASINLPTLAPVT